LIPVNHLEGNTLVVRLMNHLTSSTTNYKPVNFPFFLVLLSGGHSQLLICKDVGSYFHIGGTMDDSLGEVFDKIARILGIPFAEGGKGLELLAKNGDDTKYSFTIPLKQTKHADLSFAGLKAAVVRRIESLQQSFPDLTLPYQVRADIAASFQRIALSHVCEKVKIGLQWYKQHNPDLPLSTMVICGGVARNESLRRMVSNLALEHSMEATFPPFEFCVDNGVMIAWAGIEILMSGKGTIIYNKNEIQNVSEAYKWPLADNPHIFGEKYTKPVALRRIGMA